MESFIFYTDTTMKDYNRNNYWIAQDIVDTKRIDAESLGDALERYKEHVEQFGINISENAMRSKNAMYVDQKDGSAKQVGYVITGKTDIYNDAAHKWTGQFIDLWVRILAVFDPVFDDV